MTSAIPVPGPPRGRRLRRRSPGLTNRIAVMQRAEQQGIRPRTLLYLARDVILLLKDLVYEPRVPVGTKVLAGLALAYLASPVDLIPDVLPVVGQLDDAGVALLAVKRLIRTAGYEVVYDHWRGSDEGLALVLYLAGVEK